MRTPPRALLTVLALPAALAAGCESLPYHLANSKDKIVAVDVALEPDATLATRTGGPAAAAPHITLVQRFVRESDLHHLAAVVANVMSETRMDQMDLRATGYRSGNWNGVAGTALVVDSTPELRRLQERIVEETRAFSLNPETAKSFIATPDGSSMPDKSITVVERWVPDASGVNYRPHVAVTPVQVDAARRAESQPFESITFKPATAAVYQLGAIGTAPRLLWTWTGEPGARTP